MEYYHVLKALGSTQELFLILFVGCWGQVVPEASHEQLPRALKRLFPANPLCGHAASRPVADEPMVCSGMRWLSDIALLF
jgi:hypothetical protein